jgi:CRISPR-associated endonuclease/helicase Cas3
MPHLIYTTFDSFIHNLFRAPVAEPETWKSHFDIPRYSIYTSLIVFDEAHLFSSEAPIERPGEGHLKMFTAFSSAIKVLSSSLVPMIIMTATMPSKLIESIIENLGNPFYAPKKRVYLIEYAPELETGERKETEMRISNFYVLKIEIGDKKFFKDALKLNPELYEKTIKPDDIYIKGLEEFQKGGAVLIVRNTIKDAINIYRTLKEEKARVYLIHGRLSLGDRKKVLEEVNRCLQKERTFILVSTQVIEAGVDFDFDVLITDAAPISSIIQRVGRIGRRLETRRLLKPKIYLVEGDGSKVYDEGLTKNSIVVLKEYMKGRTMSIAWRIPRVNQKIFPGKGYVEILEDVYKEWEYKIWNPLYLALIDIDKYYMLNQKVVNRLLNDLCSFVRNEGIFQVSYWVQSESLLKGEEKNVWKKAYESLIPISMRILRNKWMNIFQVKDEAIKILCVSDDKRTIITEYSEDLYKAFERKGRTCWFLRGLERTLKRERRRGLIVVAPIIKSEFYGEEGLVFE